MPSSLYRVTQDPESYLVPCWSSVIQRVMLGWAQVAFITSHWNHGCCERNSFWGNLSSPRIVGSSSPRFTAACVAKAWMVGSSRHSLAFIWALVLDRGRGQSHFYLLCTDPLLFPEIYACPQDLAAHVVPVRCWSNRWGLEHRSALFWPTPNHSLRSFSRCFSHCKEGWISLLYS